MTEEGKSLIRELMAQKEEDKINKKNLINLENYFKNSGLIEYKKRLKEPSDEIKIREKVIIRNDMSKYKFK
tara:strand:- start:208 stop:420 length:213 start_codon:yes stop_codon:yes gene_type:complete